MAFCYVGSRTTRERNARGEGLSVYGFDAASGALQRIQLLGDLVNPSYLATTPDARHLYCVHGDGHEASAFAIAPGSGRLRFINRVDTEGRNPVHLAVMDSGLLVTNHLGASVVLLPIGADGALQPVRQRVVFDGPPGPHRIEQQQAKPHFNLVDPGGRFIIVPDKGLDRLHCLRLDDGRLATAATPFVTTREGAGPRHAVFHPALPLLYVVNELDSTVTSYRFDATSGALQPLHLVSTLPASFTGNSRAAAIAIDRVGRTLYASNRGHDSVAVFTLDAHSGLPVFQGATASGGRTPRFFTLSPDGRLLFALNEDSDSIVAFDIDPETGALDRARPVADCGSPVCMVFA